VAELAPAYLTEPYSYAEARALAEGLGISEPLAVTLVRRGYRTVAEARSFLDADEAHGPLQFEAMAEVVETLRAAIASGRRITVHGDYDVDGVCATAILVGALRELGAVCDWYIPDRLNDGYGLSIAGVGRLAARGTRLLLTADCGITCAAEVQEAKAAGMEVVITDHHSPPERLPDCPILHPRVSGYPFAELCGTGVAYKLACALRAAPAEPLDTEAAEADLDLVALATVADLVPLVGENRSLVRRGLAVARRAGRPGLRALIAASGSQPESLDEGDFAFHLAPRINAAGRLYRADAGVELFLTADEERATQIAAELDQANRERRATEREVEAAAEMARRGLPDRLRDAAALVIAGRGWHPGVVGIVASRMVERHWRPVILLSFDGQGSGRGSGRSIPGFDLLGGLEACSEHLTRFGGHRAAAGLELAESELEQFRDAFIAHTERRLGPEELTRTERIDALVGGDGLGLELAEELERLAPFGAGNPGVRLLVPSAKLGDVRSMGDGKHSRFSLLSGGARALGVAFDRASLPVTEKDQVDATVRLEVNQWNGSIEPRVVLRELYRLGEPAGAPLHRCDCEGDEWWQRFDAELAAPLEDWPAGIAEHSRAGSERQAVRGRGSAVATMAELVSSGESVLALCADASRRAELAAGATGLARFGGGAALSACARGGAGTVRDVGPRADGGLALVDFGAFAMAPEIPLRFDHVVLIDPPPFPHLAAIAARGPDDRPGFLHSAWGEQERGFALRVLEQQLGMRQPLRNAFRGLCKVRSPNEGELRGALEGGGEHPHSPELAARCVRVLRELELVVVDSSGHEWSPRVVSSEHTQLERSAAYRAYSARFEEGKKYLASLRQR
jgi:single-stranded-DNA-specific exonuclease